MDISNDPTTTESITATQPATSSQSDYLGKEEFLQLLVAQLSHQDPLNPVDNSESIAQLAQFSALEQMQNVSSQLQGLRQSSGLIDGLMLHGKNIELLTGNGTVHRGTVERITWAKDDLTLTINGESIPLSEVTEVRQVEQTENPAGETTENE
jgi:flagellar basal-body rod modification protein FlgD